MANPEPEITPEEVAEVRSDAIVATGRSDYPNQVNNVLGFPFIFRGALDVRATKINAEMKLAAVKAIADLAKEEVPDEVRMAYGNQDFTFGPEYIIPKPFDSRALTRIAPAVAKAAMESGVARLQIDNLAEYASNLANRLNTSGSFIKRLRDRHAAHIEKNKKKTKLVFAEGTNSRVLQAVSQLLAEDRIEAILLGSPKKIHAKMEKVGTPHLKDLVEIINPTKHPKFEDFCKKFSKDRERRGVTFNHAEDLMSHENYFGSMLVKTGEADAFIAGPTLSYPSCLVPVMNVVGTRDKRKAAGIFALSFKDRVLFLADCTAQLDPTAEDLSEIAISTAELYRSLMKREPRVAFLSYSTYGSNRHPNASKVQKAVALTKERQPELKCDGELQADVAVNKGILDKLFPFNDLDGPSDILIFPELNSANISYKLLSQLSDASAIGPILVPMKQTVNIIQRTAPVSEIVNMCILTALLHEERKTNK